jgi:putative transcriptional regulator
MPSAVVLPGGLQALAASRWHRIAPGVRWSRITLPEDTKANIYLLRVDAGRELPVHSHEGVEFAQVLHGAFRNGDRLLAAGDFESSCGDVHHQPTVTLEGECICLIHVNGRLAFSGPLARMLGALLRL